MLGGIAHGVDQQSTPTPAPLGIPCSVCRYSRAVQFVELLAEHEDLLQLLAQQEVMRKTLLNALKVSNRWPCNAKAPGIIVVMVHYADALRTIMCLCLRISCNIMYIEM